MVGRGGRSCDQRGAASKATATDSVAKTSTPGSAPNTSKSGDPSPTATSPRAAERLTTRRSSGRVPPIASRGVAIEVINGIEINLDGLHDDLAELKPLIRRRARSDALERETAIRAASTEDLTAQREAVRPGSRSPRGSVTVSGASAFLDGALPATVSGPEASVPISKLPRGAGCVTPRSSPGAFRVPRPTAAGSAGSGNGLLRSAPVSWRRGAHAARGVAAQGRRLSGADLVRVPPPKTPATETRPSSEGDRR